MSRVHNEESHVGSYTQMSKYSNFYSKDNTRILNNQKNQNF